MLYFSTISNLKPRKFFEKIRMFIGELDAQPHRFWLSAKSLKVYIQKNLKATFYFIDFSKVFDSIHRGRMKLILLAYSLPKETVTAIMMLFKKMKAMVHSPASNINFFNIVARVLQGDMLALYLFIICLKTQIDLIKENSFTLKKAKSRNYNKFRLCR